MESRALLEWVKSEPQQSPLEEGHMAIEFINGNMKPEPQAITCEEELEEVEFVNANLAAFEFDTDSSKDGKRRHIGGGTSKQNASKNPIEIRSFDLISDIVSAALSDLHTHDNKENNNALTCNSAEHTNANNSNGSDLNASDLYGNSNEADSSGGEPKKAMNLKTQWSHRKTTTKVMMMVGAIPKSQQPPPPRAYEFKDLYKKRKEEAMQRCQEQERKMREFHSRPMPNFKHLHHQYDNKSDFMPTVPITPKVLKKSRETDEKRKKRLEEIRQQQVHQIKAHSPKVLRTQPFIPKKEPIELEQKPFNLHSERRLRERRQFDEEVHKATEMKQKKEEERRRRHDEEEVKLFRKMATFKARPNPFK